MGDDFYGKKADRVDGENRMVDSRALWLIRASREIECENHYVLVSFPTLEKIPAQLYDRRRIQRVTELDNKTDQFFCAGQARDKGPPQISLRNRYVHTGSELLTTATIQSRWAHAYLAQLVLCCGLSIETATDTYVRRVFSGNKPVVNFKMKFKFQNIMSFIQFVSAPMQARQFQKLLGHQSKNQTRCWTKLT